MRIFSVDERELIKKRVVAFAKENKNILSAVLVGSGAVGFIDDASDLDFYLIVDSKESISGAMDYVKENIEKLSEVLTFKQMDERRLQVYLLQNYLEIDIGYTPIDETEATRERFKVMFDKTNTVGDIMGATWEKNKEISQETLFNADVQSKYEEYAGSTWHFLFHAAVAIKRGEHWRCMAEMEIVRNRVIELKGIRHSFRTGRGRDVDKFPQVELAAMQKTLVTELTREALLQNLLCLTELAYGELESGFQNNIVVSRRHAEEYIASVTEI